MFDNIFLFIQLVNKDGFSELSKSIRLSQSTISRRIQNLEVKLKVVLFKRDTRKLTLTKEGEQLYKKFVRHELMLKSDLDELMSTYSGIGGTLRIALQPTIAAQLIAARIPLFQHRFPDAELIIKYVSDSVNLLKDNYDLAVSTRMPTSQSSKIKILHKLKLKLYATLQYILAHGAPQTLDELKQRSFIGSINDDNTPMVNYIVKNDFDDTQYVLVNNSRVFGNSMLHAIEMAKCNNCIIAVWDILVQDKLEKQELVNILPEYSFGDFNCYLIRNNFNQSKLEQEFVKFIDECFN